MALLTFFPRSSSLLGIQSARCVYLQACLRKCSGNYVEPVKVAFDVYKSSSTDESAPPIIINHGLFGTKENWRVISKALESKLKRKIFSVDARNHGESPHSPHHDSAHMAEDIRELMRSEKISKASIIGHSMGGRTAMYFSLRYPDLVERAVIVDTSPLSLPKNFSCMKGILLAMKNISIPATVSMSEGRIIAEKQIKDAVQDKKMVDFILLNLGRLESGKFVWRTNAASLHDNFHLFRKFRRDIEDLNPHHGPVLFVCGNQSPYVEPNQWPDIQKIFPNSQIHWLDAGHLVHFDQPSQFVGKVVEFLK